MKSTAKKQSVYYHITQFGDAASIMKTGKLRGSMILSKEDETHIRAGISTRGWYVSLARSLSSFYIASSLRRAEGNLVVLMIDTNKIVGRFKIRPVNFGGEDSRHTSEYEERIVSDTEYLDVRHAVVGLVFLADTSDSGSVVRIPRKFFSFLRGRELFYVTRKNVFVKRKLDLNVVSSPVRLTDAQRKHPSREQRNSSYRVLLTKAEDVAHLSDRDLLRYVAYCIEMTYDVYAVPYSDSSVYAMITSEAVRRKVHPWVVMSNMLDVGKTELIARTPKIVARYVRSFSYAVAKALKLDRAELPFEKVLVELRLLEGAFRSLRLPGQQYVTDVCNVYSRLVSAIKQNQPEQMRRLRSGTLAVQEERYKFHDEHVFDFLALKAFVFSRVSSDVENKFSVGLERLYQ